MVALSCNALASKDVTFLNWVTAEPSNKPIVESLIDATEVPVNVLDSAWGDMQRNIFLRLRTNQSLDVSQLQARWLPTVGQMPNLVDFNDVFGKDFLEATISPEVLGSRSVSGQTAGHAMEYRVYQPAFQHKNARKKWCRKNTGNH